LAGFGLIVGVLNNGIKGKGRRRDKKFKKKTRRY